MTRYFAMDHRLFIAAGTMLFGCARPSLPTENTTSGIRAAEEVGASNVPRAALHLQLAKEALEQARSLSDRGEKDRAELMLARAEVDAELAVALSREDAERKQATDAVARVRTLRHENPLSANEAANTQKGSTP
jgi:hypothetical protein